MEAKYIDHMGDDLSVVNAARVSFGKRKELFDPKTDGPLIDYLARGCSKGDWQGLLDDIYEEGWEDGFHNTFGGQEELERLVEYCRSMPKHWTPFGHCTITVHLKMPMFVARQIDKHQTGFVVNEVSRRYVDDDPTLYRPPVWRARPDKSIKQGSGTDVTLSDKTERVYFDAINAAQNAYDLLLDANVAPEMARMVLPMSMYTEQWKTGSLFAWANLCNLRLDSHAQWETRELAKQVDKIIAPLYPYSWKALVRGSEA